MLGVFIGTLRRCVLIKQSYNEEYFLIVEMITVNYANELTMPYGVPCAVSPATGVIWIKD